ncbi:Piso0_005709 [Millerozyma farinosa CBS 7064]|uniref:Piso0_005709 protein n=1 Tax=Pichia sorbitophila (strain ATCC MYA-4447 / BCRC 22081 / CBS 7064 / NBRC 10061 / NRRL Y-12695) TaxID=559304 RepID=G8XZQ7_PICSO|nr:Piso0_005709 [Millerozyma farinosa CBS 7064]
MREPTGMSSRSNDSPEVQDELAISPLNRFLSYLPNGVLETPTKNEIDKRQKLIPDYTPVITASPSSDTIGGTSRLFGPFNDTNSSEYKCSKLSYNDTFKSSEPSYNIPALLSPIEFSESLSRKHNYVNDLAFPSNDAKQASVFAKRINYILQTPKQVNIIQNEDILSSPIEQTQDIVIDKDLLTSEAEKYDYFCPWDIKQKNDGHKGNNPEESMEMWQTPVKGENHEDRMMSENITEHSNPQSDPQTEQRASCEMIHSNTGPITRRNRGLQGKAVLKDANMILNSGRKKRSYKRKSWPKKEFRSQRKSKAAGNYDNLDFQKKTATKSRKNQDMNQNRMSKRTRNTEKEQQGRGKRHPDSQEDKDNSGEDDYDLSMESDLHNGTEDDIDNEYVPNYKITRSKSRKNKLHLSNYSETPEKKRRLGPRSKSGCWTCRVRHKACPEERPVCSQCSRLDLKCDYSSTRPKYMTDPSLQANKLREIKDVTIKHKKSNFSRRYRIKE